MNKDIRALIKTLYKTKTLERAHQEGFYQVFCWKILKTINLSQIFMGRQMYFYYLEWLFVYNQNKSGYLQITTLQFYYF